MIRIKAILKGNLRNNAAAEHGVLIKELPDGARVEDLKNLLGFLPGQIGVTVVNGEIVNHNPVLKDNSEVIFYELFAGG